MFLRIVGGRDKEKFDGAEEIVCNMSTKGI